MKTQKSFKSLRLKKSQVATLNAKAVNEEEQFHIYLEVH